MARTKHTRASVIKRVEREYRQLDRAVRALVRPGVLDRPVPTRMRNEQWTYKDALAHILFWKEWQTDAIARRPHPVRPPRGSLDSENRWVYEVWRKRPARDVVAWHRKLHRGVMRTLRTVPASVFATKKQAHWPYDLDGHSTSHRKQHLEAR